MCGGGLDENCSPPPPPPSHTPHAIDFHIWTLGWETMQPLGGGAFLEEACHWSGL